MPGPALPARLKSYVRPLVHAARRLRYRMAASIWPPQAWNGRHHPVFARFEPWTGEADGRFHHDFLGTRTDPAFQPALRADPAGPLRTDWPRPYPDYFELAFVLESVLAEAAAPSLTVVELGAGYGRWLVTARQARRRSGGGAIRLVGVEMVPQHFEWMREHFANNGIDAQDHLLIHAAVSDVDGVALYRPVDPEFRYGQSCGSRSARPGAAASAGPTAGRAQADGTGTVRVPAIDLSRLLREQDRVDLMHVDIQGEERRALPAAQAELDRRVARLLVATHSRRIHRALRRRLAEAGWHVVYDFRCGRRERTPFGDVHFADGLLAAVNPRLSADGQTTPT